MIKLSFCNGFPTNDLLHHMQLHLKLKCAQEFPKSFHTQKGKMLCYAFLPNGRNGSWKRRKKGNFSSWGSISTCTLYITFIWDHILWAETLFNLMVKIRCRKEYFSVESTPNTSINMNKSLLFGWWIKNLILIETS